MHLRKVFIIHLTLEEEHQLIPLQWADLFSWSGEKIQKFVCYSNSAVTWASLCLTSLQELIIDGEYISSDEIKQILRNNADTLISVTVSAQNYGSEGEVDFKSAWYPHLLILDWAIEEDTYLCKLLKYCPNLVALSISESSDDLLSVALAIAISKSCPQLQRLRIDGSNWLDGDLLLWIAEGCPQLEYLELSLNDVVEERLPDVVSALPCLHTLVVASGLSEFTVLEIAAKGAPSLRILDARTEFTCAGLRQLTASLPLLTGLTVYLNYFEPNHAPINFWSIAEA